jgi:hypothetical protein
MGRGLSGTSRIAKDLLTHARPQSAAVETAFLSTYINPCKKAAIEKHEKSAFKLGIGLKRPEYRWQRWNRGWSPDVRAI